MEYNRDATNSFKGYEYQYYYFIKKILQEFNEIELIEFEGLEDIDIIYKNNNKMKTIIQVKYHSENTSTKEGTNKSSGLYKVIQSYLNNYNNTYNKENIYEIIYFVTNESQLNSTKIYTNLFDALEKQKIITHICKDININCTESNIIDITNKLKIINTNNFNIDNIINEIYDLIKTNIFFNIGGDMKYKKEIIYAKINFELNKNIFNYTNKINISELFNKIKESINNDYNINSLIIEILNSNNNFDYLFHNNILSILNIDILIDIMKKNKNINKINLLKCKKIIIQHIYEMLQNQIEDDNYKYLLYISDAIYKEKSNNYNGIKFIYHKYTDKKYQKDDKTYIIKNDELYDINNKKYGTYNNGKIIKKTN